MTITRAAVAVGALILLASCGSGDFVDTAPVEKDVKATIDGPGSVKVKSVDCPTDEEFILPIGKAKVEREGRHVTIVAYSIMVGLAMQAAEALAG